MSREKICKSSNNYPNKQTLSAKIAKKREKAVKPSLFELLSFMNYLPRMIPAVPVISATVIAPSSSTSALSKLNTSGFLPRM